MIQKPINATLPATGETPVLVELPSGQACSDFGIQARGSVDMQISDVSAMTTYWTVKADTAISLAETFGKDVALFYAVSGSTADTVEVLPKKNPKY